MARTTRTRAPQNTTPQTMSATTTTRPTSVHTLPKLIVHLTPKFYWTHLSNMF